MSGSDGGYVLTNLPFGPYQIEVTKEGFTKVRAIRPRAGGECRRRRAGGVPGVNDDISWIKGAHQMTFRAGGLVGRYGELNNFAGSGQFTFGRAATGSGVRNFTRRFHDS